jgi:hypothetical protein
MGFDQYHEPPSELSQETRTFARMIKSLIEEAEAIDWYEQRISVEKDKEAKAIMENTQKEEFIHFAMDLEFLLRKKAKWNIIMKNVLFKPGDIIENGENAEHEGRSDGESRVGSQQSGVKNHKPIGNCMMIQLEYISEISRCRHIFTRKIPQKIKKAFVFFGSGIPHRLS